MFWLEFIQRQTNREKKQQHANIKRQNMTLNIKKNGFLPRSNILSHFYSTHANSKITRQNEEHKQTEIDVPSLSRSFACVIYLFKCKCTQAKFYWLDSTVCKCVWVNRLFHSLRSFYDVHVILFRWFLCLLNLRSAFVSVFRLTIIDNFSLSLESSHQQKTIAKLE